MTYADRHHRLVEYLLMKVTEHDWHGVSDAANDLRVLEASHLSQEIGKGTPHPVTEGPNSHGGGATGIGDKRLTHE